MDYCFNKKVTVTSTIFKPNYVLYFMYNGKKDEINVRYCIINPTSPCEPLILKLLSFTQVSMLN